MAWRVLKLQMGKTALGYRWGRRGAAGVFIQHSLITVA